MLNSSLELTIVIDTDSSILEHIIFWELSMTLHCSDTCSILVSSHSFLSSMLYARVRNVYNNWTMTTVCTLGLGDMHAQTILAGAGDFCNVTFFDKLGLILKLTYDYIVQFF